jgi:hypothetical protein
MTWDPYPEIRERFERETVKHEMRVLHDDGLYRHLRFRRPDHNAYWFDLITWPGCLTFRGDFTTSYTFARLEDMFEFFRGKHINPDYWAEKLGGGREGVRTYSAEVFEQRVKEYVVEAIRDGWAPRGSGRAVTEFLRGADTSTEEAAHQALEDFEFGVGYRAKCSCGESQAVESYTSGVLWGGRHERSNVGHKVTTQLERGLKFEDTWEWSFREYDWEYLWACHAIVWAIRQYDNERRKPAPKQLVETVALPEAVTA